MSELIAVMTPSTSPSSAKKPRWSTEKKSAARKAPAGRGRPDHRDGAEPRSFRPREDRPARADRDDRPDRGDRPFRSRDERPFRSDDRGDRGGFRPREDRPFRSRDDRGGDRAPYRPREDRPFRGRDERGERGDRAPYRAREDRPFRSRDDRGERAERGGYAGRDDRAPYRPREDRPFRSRDDRGERAERGGYAGRDDRAPYRPREDRPFRSRDDRGERAERGGYAGRDDRAPYRPREERPARSWDSQPSRGERHGRRDDAPRHGGHAHTAGHPTRPGQDAESERLAADTWTKATSAHVVTGPVTVAEDNGFAALGLPERLVERLARDGITTPFPIQSATVPDALAGKDVLGRGRTGSGKTLAFGLPVVTRLLALTDERGRSAARRPRALVMVPTRELAMQVSDVLEPLVHVVGLRHKLVAGGLSYTNQISALERGVDLLIATPGRLADLLERGAVELDDVVVTVLDEADHMAEMGFLPEITAILDKIPGGGQRLLFSATLDSGIDGLVERYLTDPVVHSTDEAQASVSTMDHHVLLVHPHHKKRITAEVAGRPGRTIVFVRTKLGADRVAGELREQGVLAAALHGGLSQGVRNRVLGAFRDGSLPVLVATDVAARGIHVDDVTVVLQVDPPADHKDYLHRSGRTARAGEKGAVVTLALPHQKRTMERQLREAGVDTAPVAAAPGDEVLVAAGATEPSGVPVPDAVYRRLIEAPARPRGGRPGGPRGGGPGRRPAPRTASRREPRY
ncbi:superfamily II DNA/RNA helicase [Lapillicoccus jejuensis]|uniref:Superfamily II DNA/RNA helicase n=2 Tax=Lapillicoccus jejuensis TaxID=402171 RepID=A0A542DVR1_9MICO|nr:superfamily II DNA/RNA helicase [Lapillicoccus jejuensis]